MRFNKQELLTIACQPSNRFDKEGSLVVYEKQDSILFKRQESKLRHPFFSASLKCMVCLLVFDFVFFVLVILCARVSSGFVFFPSLIGGTSGLRAFDWGSQVAEIIAQELELLCRAEQRYCFIPTMFFFMLA